MEKIATDIFTFENLCRPGFTYVDNTGLALSLVNLSICNQIEEMGYAVTYSSNPRKTFRIGCAFDCEKRSLGKWMVEATRS